MRLWLGPRLEQRVKLLVAGSPALCLVILSFQGRRSQLSRIQAEEDASAVIVVACRALRPLSVALEWSDQRGSAGPSPLNFIGAGGKRKSHLDLPPPALLAGIFGGRLRASDCHCLAGGAEMALERRLSRQKGSRPLSGALSILHVDLSRLLFRGGAWGVHVTPVPSTVLGQLLNSSTAPTPLSSSSFFRFSTP